jgi:hypothetical protein
MKLWEDLPVDAQETMRFLGEFRPTVDIDKKELKGYMWDEDGGGKVYFSEGLPDICTSLLCG